MNKKENPINSKVLALAIAILIIMALALYVLWSMPGDFVFEEHLEDIALTVRKADVEGDEEVCVSLKELSYYIMLSEENVQRLAEIYNQSNTNQFWNIFTNHTFIKSKAKELASDACVRDVIYSIEAKKQGMELTAEEMAAIEYRAEDLYDGLSYKQQRATQLDAATIKQVLERLQLASKYANYLLENHDFSVSEHMPQVEVELGGDYYETLKKGYTITKADWYEDLNLGKITVEPYVE